MKSKILSLTMLVFMLTLSLVACGGSNEHTHTWEAATCVTAKTCSECGIETGTVSTTNHNYGEWQTVKTVSCTENGIKKQTCSWCNNEKTETITATGHNYVDSICKNCNVSEKIAVRDLVTTDFDGYTTFYIAVENEKGILTKGNIEVVINITNDNVNVYKKTFHISVSDFYEHKRSNGDIELRAAIKVYLDEIQPGINSYAIISFTCQGENGTNLPTQKLEYTWRRVPQLQTTLNIPTLPKTIYNKSYSGTTNQMLKVTDITYEVSGTTMYIYFSGEKTFDSEGNNYSRISEIGFKLYDSNGNVIDSGTVYVTALAVGDKFANAKEYVYGITLGENYTLELIDVT